MNLTNHDLGQLDRVDDEHWQVRYTRSLKHPPEKVWRALAEPEHRDAWFPQRIEADGDWVAGARLRFVSDLMPEANFGGELLVYDPPRTLEMRWGTDILRFELAADGDGTLLTLTDTIEERGTAARTGAGWLSGIAALRRYHELPQWRTIWRQIEIAGVPEGMFSSIDQ